VFLPMAFFGGSTGVIYRQFSLTIISAMTLSVLVALILSPALTSTLLQARTEGEDHKAWLDRRFPAVAGAVRNGQKWFNTGFNAMIERYGRAVSRVIDRKFLFLGIFAGTIAVLVVLFVRLPSGFLPTEDQGFVQVQARLPAGTTIERTQQVQLQMERYFFGTEKANVAAGFLVAGGNQGGSGQNSGQGFLNLTDWAERSSADRSADAIARRATQAARGLRDAQVFVLVPPAIRGLGSSNGFTMELLNSSGMSHDDFLAARDKLIADAAKDPRLASVRASDLPDNATLKVDFDTPRLTAYGVNPADVNATLSTAWGGRYVNDYIENGRVKRVYLQGDAEFRSQPQDMAQWFVRNSSGLMTPFSAFSKISWSTAPTSLSRFGGVPAYEIQGQAGAGSSSGDAMTAIEELAAKIPGTTVAWAGSSYEERLSSGRAPLLYSISLFVVFLCLAALYESWSIPVAVLLVVPLGLIGAVFAVTLRGLQNDVYLQIGLITTMGLAAKNAILMIEFAEQAERKGMRVIDAALEAARIRLRPILMTSFAFVFGVMPLAVATGAGANSRIAIGTSVIGGMLTATILAVFYIPLFFVMVRRGVRDGFRALRQRYAPPAEPAE
jgi:multidrug efflux pump